MKLISPHVHFTLMMFFPLTPDFRLISDLRRGRLILAATPCSPRRLGGDAALAGAFTAFTLIASASRPID
jgi:hypothetical protein